MDSKILRVEYFYATAEDRPGEAYQILSQLASLNVNLLAFSVIPTGPNHTQMMLFPESVERLISAVQRIGVSLTGPHRAFLIQGDDRLGAFADIHRQMSDAGINVYATNGVTDGRGGFGYILYVRPEHYEEAGQVLGI